MRKPIEPVNLTNMCLDEFGENLTCFYHDTMDQRIAIKNYKVNPQIKPKSANSSVFTYLTVGKLPNKMTMTESIELETNYFPGFTYICWTMYSTKPVLLFV